MVNGVLNGFANQALGAFTGNGLDANARSVWKANAFGAQFLGQECDELLSLRAVGCIFNPSINVFRIFTKQVYVGFFGFANWRRHAFEIAQWSQADIQIKRLPKCHIERSDIAFCGHIQWALDGHHIVLQGRQSFFGQINFSAIQVGGFFSREHFHPLNASLTLVGFLHSCVDHLDHDGGDVDTRAIAFNVRNDGVIGNVQCIVGIDRNFASLGGQLNVLVHGKNSLLIHSSHKISHNQRRNNCRIRTQKVYQPCQCSKSFPNYSSPWACCWLAVRSPSMSWRKAHRKHSYRASH